MTESCGQLAEDEPGTDCSADNAVPLSEPTGSGSERNGSSGKAVGED